MQRCRTWRSILQRRFPDPCSRFWAIGSKREVLAQKKKMRRQLPIIDTMIVILPPRTSSGCWSWRQGWDYINKSDAQGLKGQGSSPLCEPNFKVSSKGRIEPCTYINLWGHNTFVLFDKKSKSKKLVRMPNCDPTSPIKYSLCSSKTHVLVPRQHVQPGQTGNCIGNCRCSIYFWQGDISCAQVVSSWVHLNCLELVSVIDQGNKKKEAKVRN